MSHFHPAVGGGISSLERAVENLYSLQMLFTLLSNKSSSFSGSNRFINSFFVPDVLICSS